jgi:hypothetical protein
MLMKLTPGAAMPFETPYCGKLETPTFRRKEATSMRVNSLSWFIFFTNSNPRMN